MLNAFVLSVGLTWNGNHLVLRKGNNSNKTMSSAHNFRIMSEIIYSYLYLLLMILQFVVQLLIARLQLHSYYIIRSIKHIAIFVLIIKMSSFFICTSVLNFHSFFSTLMLCSNHNSSNQCIQVNSSIFLNLSFIEGTAILCLS